MYHLYPPAIYDLIQSLRKLPSIGARSAEKLAFALLQWPQAQLHSFCQTIEISKQSVETCSTCGCLYDKSTTCWSCSQNDGKLICVVSQAREAFAIHATASMQSPFHVLGGLIDPMHGIEVEDLNISNLLQRITTGDVSEVLIALDATLEGDATALYIKAQIEEHIHPTKPWIKISRLAFGMPMNSSLELVDPATLSRAISSKSYW